MYLHLSLYQPILGGVLAKPLHFTPLPGRVLFYKSVARFRPGIKMHLWKCDHVTKVWRHSKMDWDPTAQDAFGGVLGTSCLRSHTNESILSGIQGPLNRPALLAQMITQLILWMTTGEFFVIQILSVRAHVNARSEHGLHYIFVIRTSEAQQMQHDMKLKTEKEERAG